MSRNLVGISIAALALAIGGCGEDTKLNNEYNPKPVAVEKTPDKTPKTDLEKKIVDAQTMLEGKIIRVQPSTFSGHLSSNSSYFTHEFLYVIVESAGKKYFLVYPFSYPVVEGSEAIITYRQIPSGCLTTCEFGKIFLRTDFMQTSDDFIIKADGAITKDGIIYK